MPINDCGACGAPASYTQGGNCTRCGAENLPTEMYQFPHNALLLLTHAQLHLQAIIAEGKDVDRLKLVLTHLSVAAEHVANELTNEQQCIDLREERARHLLREIAERND